MLVTCNLYPKSKKETAFSGRKESASRNMNTREHARTFLFRDISSLECFNYLKLFQNIEPWLIVSCHGRE